VAFNPSNTVARPYGHIYLITHLDSGRYYVGQTTNIRPICRWQSHVCDGKRNAGSTIDRAIGKYGPRAFSFELMAAATTQPELDGLESLWIIVLQSTQRGIGFNIREGGSYGHHSQETKNKLREARLQQVIKPESYKLGAEKRRGQKRDPSATEKTRQALIGRIFSEETKRRMSDGQKRRLENPEYRAKLVAQSIAAAKAPRRPYIPNEQERKIIGERKRQWSFDNPDKVAQIGRDNIVKLKQRWANMTAEERAAKIAPMKKARWPHRGV
jgi:group I intron endonuclease